MGLIFFEPQNSFDQSYAIWQREGADYGSHLLQGTTHTCSTYWATTYKQGTPRYKHNTPPPSPTAIPTHIPPIIQNWFPHIHPSIQAHTPTPTPTSTPTPTLKPQSSQALSTKPPLDTSTPNPIPTLPPLTPQYGVGEVSLAPPPLKMNAWSSACAACSCSGAPLNSTMRSLHPSATSCNLTWAPLIWNCAEEGNTLKWNKTQKNKGENPKNKTRKK